MLKCYSFWGSKAGPEHWLIFADFALQVHSAVLAKSVVKQYKIENSLNYWNRKEGLQIWRIVERINIFCSNQTQEVWMFIFKTAWKSYCKNNEKIPGNLQKNLEKSWKYHGILSVWKSGNPVILNVSCTQHLFNEPVINESKPKKSGSFHVKVFFFFLKS